MTVKTCSDRKSELTPKIDTLLENLEIMFIFFRLHGVTSHRPEEVCMVV